MKRYAILMLVLGIFTTDTADAGIGDCLRAFFSHRRSYHQVQPIKPIKKTPIVIPEEVPAPMLEEDVTKVYPVPKKAPVKVNSTPRASKTQSPRKTKEELPVIAPIPIINKKKKPFSLLPMFPGKKK